MVDVLFKFMHNQRSKTQHGGNHLHNPCKTTPWARRLTCSLGISLANRAHNFLLCPLLFIPVRNLRCQTHLSVAPSKGFQQNKTNVPKFQYEPPKSKSSNKCVLLQPGSCSFEVGWFCEGMVVLKSFLTEEVVSDYVYVNDNVSATEEYLQHLLFSRRNRRQTRWILSANSKEGVQASGIQFGSDWKCAVERWICEWCALGSTGIQ